MLVYVRLYHFYLSRCKSHDLYRIIAIFITIIHQVILCEVIAIIICIFNVSIINHIILCGITTIIIYIFIHSFYHNFGINTILGYLHAHLPYWARQLNKYS